MQQNSILACQASSMKCVGCSLYPQCEDLYFILSCKLFRGLCGCFFFFFFNHENIGGNLFEMFHLFLQFSRFR